MGTFVKVSEQSLPVSICLTHTLDLVDKSLKLCRGHFSQFCSSLSVWYVNNKSTRMVGNLSKTNDPSNFLSL